MPDHLHLLLVLKDQSDLSQVVGLLKGRRFIGHMSVWDGGGSLRQRAFYDHAAGRDEDIRKPARYIVANPIRADIVEKIGDYPLWVAVWV